MKNRALIALVTIVVAIFGGLALTQPQAGARAVHLVPAARRASPATPAPRRRSSTTTSARRSRRPSRACRTSRAPPRSAARTSRIITAKFTYGTDLATAEQKIDQAINRIKSTLPAGVDPQVLSGSIDDLPGHPARGHQRQGPEDPRRRHHQARDPRHQGCEGRQRRPAGRRGRSADHHHPRRGEARRGRAHLQAIKDALQQNGVLIPGGSHHRERQDALGAVRHASSARSTTSRALPLVRSRARRAVRSRRRGRAGAAPPAPQPRRRDRRRPRRRRRSATSRPSPRPTTRSPRSRASNGKPALTIAVTKLPSANTVEVSHARHRAHPRAWRRSSARDAKITVVFDQAPFITQSINSLTEEGLLGLVHGGHRHPGLPAVGALDTGDRHLHPDQCADHLHRDVGHRLHAQHHHARRADDRDRARGRRLHRRHREHQAAAGGGRRPGASPSCGRARGRRRDHRIHHHDRRRVPAARVRRAT